MPIIGDVFGLNSIYEKQVENIDNNNFESWPESATYGYFGGGAYPPLNPDQVTTIDRIDFSNETTSAPGYNLTQARSFIAAVSSSSYGYFGGGYAPPVNIVATIDRIDFSNETTSPVTDNLTQARYGLAACSSSSYGYFGGGVFSPSDYVATVDRIDFSNETRSTPGYNLTQGRSDLAACSSSSYGYFGGGITSPSNYVATVDRIDFSNETTFAPGNNLLQARYYLAACSSSSYGYFGGGRDTGYNPIVDRIDFSNETTFAPGYNLTQPRRNLAAVSGGASHRIKGSRTYGYFVAGYAEDLNPRWIATQERLDFSNETTSGPGNDLPQERSSLAACSSNSYGYFAGGSIAPPPPDRIVATVDRIDFSNETTSAPGYNLTQARYGLAAVSSNFYGYFGGGGTSPFGNIQTNTIDRLDFSIETTSLPGNNLPQVRQRLAACSSNSYGYFGGGLIEGSPSDIESDTIERLDFSNETLTSTATLSQARYSLAAVSSNSYGYFAGGKFVFPVSSHTNRIDRFDFSNETATNTLTYLPQSRASLSAVSSNSYGYFGGGNYGPIDVNTIDRIDFSNDTTSPVTDTLSNGVISSAAVSN